jgi:hypothetical protein
MRGCRVSDDDLLLAKDMSRNEYRPLHYRATVQGPARPRLEPRRRTTTSALRGNTEGTSARPPAGTRAHSSSCDSFFLRGFRARGFPALPALPASSLDGKEGVDGSSPSEGFAEMPAK